ncbi:APC family permease [Paeniglutamicibacter terrestris]|jgi:amino acid transporter|uniref:APC family permease n=1 Tax=Paeniglutamicibacter terrestris TaxID=2723403 RepID=A0ABX1G0I8_9MICC|nr:APC family permease [Paeniglutamicibacter terrestris]ASN38278.1 amino acid transporter [Arthrobacter sp. 7749]NKG19508.1 APC family permease [Paeniglutamicibacter terrestris]
MSRESATEASSVSTGESGLGEKGLSKGTVGVIGAVVIGISCIAPAYTLTAALGPTVAEVGTQLPAIFIAGFLPMLLVALGYRELNAAMPDSGTSFTWATRAFGPWIGWMGGWGLIAATVIVLSNLAAVAVDFFYILLAQLTGNAGIAELTKNLWVNIPTTLIFIAAACWISYRGMQTTKTFQYVLVAFQLVVLAWFAIAAFSHVNNGTAFDPTPISLDWFNPLAVESFGAFAAGVSLSIFIFWGWDVTLTMNEETKNPDKVPGRAATLTVLIIMAIYMIISLAVIAYAGTGTTGLGAGNPDNQESIFAVLAGPIMGPFAILMSLAILSSSAASLQSTLVSPARTLLAMGYYKALPDAFGKISPRFMSPSVATITAGAAAAGFYVITRLLSENALWDTITALGLMICFYYGVTALACVWYFRRECFSSLRNFFFKFLAPLVGGVILLVMFLSTAHDSMDPDYGSGSNIGGLGMVFILGMGVLLLGVGIMVYMRIKSPGFFKGETLKRLK